MGGDGPRPPAAGPSDPAGGFRDDLRPDSGSALVHDPAHGLTVTVRRHLDNAPVPEWRALVQQAGQPPFTGPTGCGPCTPTSAGEPLLVSVRSDGRLLAFGRSRSSAARVPC